MRTDDQKRLDSIEKQNRGSTLKEQRDRQTDGQAEKQTDGRGDQQYISIHWTAYVCFNDDRNRANGGITTTIKHAIKLGIKLET